MEVFKILVSGGLLVYACHLLCVIVDTIGKCYTVNKCKDYTDSQTKSLSQMFCTLYLQSAIAGVKLCRGQKLVRLPLVSGVDVWVSRDGNL